MMPGEPAARFITLEGGEGAGKSTQVENLSGMLTDLGVKHILTREPGGSAGAEQIRRLLVEGEASRWDAETEALLHFAARRDHLVKTIEPALRRGQWVVCDRYIDSTIAYQGYGRGVPINSLMYIYKMINKNIGHNPDLTFLLDLPPATGLKRAVNRFANESKKNQEDRYEGFSIDFHNRLREGFLEASRRQPKRFVVIDASQRPSEVFDIIRDSINSRYFKNIS